MAEAFHGSHLKVQRANKHIADIHQMLLAFADSDFYSARIEHNSERRTNFLRFDVDTSRFPVEDISLTIGDAVQNLRSALDHMWYETIIACGGKPTFWTNFPIRNAGDSLANSLNEALKKKQITIEIIELMMGIKPYQGGNTAIWGLDQLSDADKHQMLVPVLKLMGFHDVRLEDDQHRMIGKSAYIMDESSRIRLFDADDLTVTVKNKGHATITVLFDEGTIFWGEAVAPTLKRVSEEVERVIEAFSRLLTGKP